MPNIHAPTYQPTQRVALIHDSALREAFIANALIWVAKNFSDYLDYIKAGAGDGDDPGMLDLIDEELFNVWIYSIVTEAANHARQRSSFGVMDLSNLGDVLAHLAGDE